MLTETKLKALRPRGKLYRITDGNGLCIRYTRPSSRRESGTMPRSPTRASLATCCGHCGPIAAGSWWRAR